MKVFIKEWIIFELHKAESEEWRMIEEIDNIKYWVCCPMCDNEKCVRGTDKCEAEIWVKNKIKSEE